MPPVGQSMTVSVQSGTGSTTVTGHYYAYNHLPGGLLYVPAPGLGGSGPVMPADAQLGFLAEGQAFVTSRPAD